MRQKAEKITSFYLNLDLMRIYLKPKRKRQSKKNVSNTSNKFPYIIKNGVKYILCSIDNENAIYLNDIKNKRTAIK